MIFKDKKIVILMATYNGELFIQEQMNSLLEQTYQNFLIYVRDDCSIDKTYAILEEYQKKYPNKIFITQNTINSGSGKNVFYDLIKEIDADYYLLCDQDDVWINNKVQILLDHIFSIENNNKGIPILIHSDAFVVDGELNLISDSLLKRMKLDKIIYSLNHALSQNVITGCTTIFNKSLKDMMNQKPIFSVMHDWWIYLIAISFGVVEKNQNKLINYRIHAQNSVGAFDSHNLFLLIKKFFNKNENQKNINDSYLQAKYFYKIFGQKLNESQNILLKHYITLPEKRKIQKIISVLYYKFYKMPYYKTIGHLFYL